MQYNYDLQRPQNLTKIQSSAFDIYKVTIQGQQYFGYFPKQQQLRQTHLNEFLEKDMQNQFELKYLRKYNPYASKGCYAFEYYKDYQLLSDLKQIPEKVILKIAQDLIIALFQIHQKGLLGRSFNVNNIIFVDNQHATMMEYGFYPNIDFQPPEMVYNQGSYTEKIDIFQLGRVLYNLMIGSDIPQFKLSNINEVQSDINLQIASSCYSESLKVVVISMLQNNVNKRITYSQLVQKFRNNYYFSIQEQFYSQNLLKSMTQQLIEKRESNFELILQSQDAFVIEQTQNIQKLFKEQLQAQEQQNQQQFKSGSIILENEKPNHQVDKYNTPTPIKEQQLDDLYPPLTQKSLPGAKDNSQLYYQQQQQNQNQNQKYAQPQQQQQNPNLQQYKNLHSNVTDVSNVSKQFKNQDEQISSSLTSHDLLLTVLPYLNADRPDNFIIWNQIYFFLYRFSLMRKLQDFLQDQQRKQQNQSMVSIAIFSLKKASIILKQEYQTFLEQGANIYDVSQNEWLKFVKESNEYSRMVQKLRQDLNVSIQQFKGKDYQEVRKAIDQGSQDQLMKELYQYTSGFLDDNLNYKNFEDIKKSYRYVLTNTLSLFDNNIDEYQTAQIRLLILMCILINRICDRVHVPLHFKTIASNLKLEQVSSIVEIELFLRQAKVQDYQKQFDELKEVYFSG